MLWASNRLHVEMFDWERESREHLEVEQQIFWCEEFGNLNRGYCLRLYPK